MKRRDLLRGGAFGVAALQSVAGLQSAGITPLQIETSAIRLRISGTKETAWSLTDVAGSSTCEFGPPAFTIDGKLLQGALTSVGASASRTLANGVTEHRFHGDFAEDGTLSLEMVFRTAPESPVVRFRYQLHSATKTHRLQGLDTLCYFAFPVSGTSRVYEVQISVFNEMIHSYTMYERLASDAELGDAIPLLGPILVTEDSAQNTLLVAYEHGAEAPEAFLHFHPTRTKRIELRAAKGNYIPGAPAHGYSTVWMHAALSPGGVGRIREHFRTFVRKWMSLNGESRKPYLFYNTWNYQERNKWWNGQSYLANVLIVVYTTFRMSGGSLRMEERNRLRRLGNSDQASVVKRSVSIDTCQIKRIASLADATCRRVIALSAVAVLLCGMPTAVFGQGQTAFASLSGEVHDSSGAIIVGATVILSSNATGIRHTFTTDSGGRYTFTQVPPGAYSLNVTHPGFSTYVQNGLVLEVGQPSVQDVTLSVGNVNQQIVVTAEAPPLNTANANLGADVSERQITQLPLDYRAPFLLVTLLSSVNTGQIWQSFNSGTQLSGPGADQDASAFTFGGSRFGDTGFLLDGHWNGNGSWDAIMYSPSVDETQEFRIQQNVFTAQYGRSMGNVVNAITKSGTSSFHGDLFEFLRNSDLDANNFFNNRAGLPKPHFERNQFGGTIAGPVYIPKFYEQRDKTFFFGSYEGLRQSTPLTAVLTMPLNPFLTGDFSSLLGSRVGTDALGRPVYKGQIYNPFTTRTITAGQVDPVTGLVAQQSGYIRDPFQANRIPSTLINPVAAKVVAFYPAPNGPGTVNNYTSTIGVPASQDKYTFRIDQNINDAARFFARWSQAFEYKTRNGAFFGPNNPAGYGEQAGNNRFDLGLGFSYNFNPTLVMSAAAGVNRWVETRTEQGYPFAPSQLGFRPSSTHSPISFPISLSVERHL